MYQFSPYEFAEVPKVRPVLGVLKHCLNLKLREKNTLFSLFIFLKGVINPTKSQQLAKFTVVSHVEIAI